MPKIAKVAISLPEATLNAIEKERKAKGETRSEFFRRAAECLLKQEKEALLVREYRRGYQANPETDDEVEAATKPGRRSLAEEPWE